MPSSAETNIWGTVTCNRTDVSRLYWWLEGQKKSEDQWFNPRQPALDSALAGTRIDEPRTIYFMGERRSLLGQVTHQSQTVALNFTRRMLVVDEPRPEIQPFDLSDLTFNFELGDDDPAVDFVWEVKPA